MFVKIRFLIFFLVLIPAFLLIGPLPALAKEKTAKPVSVRVEKPVPVQVTQVKKQVLPVVVEAVGRLHPNRQVTVTAQLPGMIAGYKAEQGDLVKAGQLLITIDPVDYELAYEEAKANLLAVQAGLYAASNAFERAKKLLPRKVISTDNFEKAEAEFKSAQAQEVRAKVGVKIARERLKKTRLTAPFSGLVAARYIEAGQLISVGMPLMSIMDLSRVRVMVYLTEKDYVHLDAEDPVKVRVEAYPTLTFNGKVDRISISADAATNTFGAEILIENLDLVLKAGLSARVFLTTRVLNGVILIPQSAVLYREKGPEVYVLDSNLQAQKRNVKLGLTRGDRVQVIEGLTSGEKLVVKGQNYLKPGVKASVRD
ncbi:MAG: efflux RND transporter periplasmic adaptor subunit [Deltaproteobacteria bacterium]|nr:efflux RND transporter periplasmic adaptor subunit [Deltaproteobacteria bacterium]